MFKKIFFSTLACQVFTQALLLSHCQMPCGIYHDDMVFDQIDQYIETMAKAISVLNENTYKSVQDHNVSTRWIILKENGSNEITNLITTYFLQQKIKPDEADTTQKLLSAHKMLLSLVKIKQTVDLKVLNDFYEEWEKFKVMFPIPGYKSKVSELKLKAMKESAAEKDKGNITTHSNHTHDHSH